MLKQLQDVLLLAEKMPAYFQKQAATALMKVLDEYEDWVSCGEPPLPDRWPMVKFVRNPRFAGTKLQQVIQHILESE